MNKQRKVLITVTYNEMGIIIDTKAEEVAQLNLQPTCNELATDCISRQAALDIAYKYCPDDDGVCSKAGCDPREMLDEIEALPPAQPEQRWIPCGKCIHADGKHRWCKVLDRTINEDYFCYWAEPYRKEGDADA